MFSLAILSAYISILSLVFLSIVLFGLKGLAILYVLRMIAAGCFILYAVKLKKN